MRTPRLLSALSARPLPRPARSLARSLAGTVGVQPREEDTGAVGRLNLTSFHCGLLLVGRLP